MIPKEDVKLLLGCIGGSIVAYHAARLTVNYLKSLRSDDEWIPVGTVKHLRIYPIKSCKARELFSFHCGPLGGSFGENHDRHFIIMDEASGRFYTARTHPRLQLLHSDVSEGRLTITGPEGETVSVDLNDVLRQKDVRRVTLFAVIDMDGVDCGDAVAAFFQKYTGEEGMRLAMYTPGLFSGRPNLSKGDYWDPAVPKRNDPVAFPDLAPYMITTEPSCVDLNKRLEKKVTSLNFRANIVVDQCVPWEEDTWLYLRIGDVVLQCFLPCTRCVMTTIDPASGTKNPKMQPLKELRSFRALPEGPLKKEFGDSPMFGVNAGLASAPGYIHVGQVVWAKRKPKVAQ